MMTKQQIINYLDLQPHIEGGYFRRTYESNWILNEGNTYQSSRPTLTTIYYLLTNDSPIGHLHKNRSDIVHFFHLGGAVRYTMIHLNGELEQVTLGPGLEQGHQLQMTVLGGSWKASELIDDEYGLVSEAVTPGFDYQDMQLANLQTLRTEFPKLFPGLEKFIKYKE